MIVVDSSVWISHFRGDLTESVLKLRALPGPDDILMGDLILLELLQGARNDTHAARIEREFERFTVATMLGAPLVAQSAENYRRLRRLGITVRKTVDVIIGTFCIEGRHRLLHGDRDFNQMVRHLGLQVV